MKLIISILRKAWWKDMRLAIRKFLKDENTHLGVFVFIKRFKYENFSFICCILGRSELGR